MFACCRNELLLKFILSILASNTYKLCSFLLLSSVLFVLSTEECMHNSVAVGCCHTHIHIHLSTCASSFACVSKIILEDKDIMFIVFNKKCLFFALFVSSSLILFLVLLLLLPPYLLLFAKYVFFLFVKLSTNSLRLPGLMDGWMPPLVEVLNMGHVRCLYFLEPTVTSNKGHVCVLILCHLMSKHNRNRKVHTVMMCGCSICCCLCC